MNNLKTLAQMGCGKEILNSVIERGNIQAAINNCNKFLKYYKYAVKSDLYTKEQAINGLYKYYNELISIEHIANKYDYLWQEKFYKCKLLTEKFMEI
jgi:hypothetical protein